MALSYCDLDASTRPLMLEELAADASSRTMQPSKWLTEAGRTHWPELMRRAINEGNDATLARDIRLHGYLELYLIHHRNGRPYRSRVPYTAADTLADCEFNHYYCRAVCRRSLDGGNGLVEVYRAKSVRDPRPRSQQIIGALVDAQKLLDDLRAHPGGLDAALEVPAGPNSGLSVKLRREGPFGGGGVEKLPKVG
jgi:hypothetical protein